MSDTPCLLHIPFSRVKNKIKEITIGVVMPGRVFHNNPIPVEYAKVLTREITNISYIKYPLDHVTPEGVKEFGKTVNQFILWNRCEIVLDGLASPKDKEAPLPMSPPSVPKFKEASPLSTLPVKVMPQQELGH
jgi:hypothetical protein